MSEAGERGERAAATAPPGRVRPGGLRRRPSKGDRRHEALLDALEELLAELPIAELSVDRITSRAGVGRTAFYFYFPSMEAALRALVERSLAAIWETAGGWFFGEAEPRAALRGAVEGVVRAWDEHADVLAGVVDATGYDPGMREFWDRQLEGFIAVVSARVERDVAAGLVPAEVDARGVAEALCWMTERCCYVYIARRGGVRDSERLVGALFDVWWGALYGR